MTGQDIWVVTLHRAGKMAVVGALPGEIGYRLGCAWAREISALPYAVANVRRLHRADFDVNRFDDYPSLTGVVGWQKDYQPEGIRPAGRG